MSRSYADVDFRKDISKALNEVKEKQRFSVKDAAKELGIKRQAFYQYLKGTTTPRPEVLIKMIKKWDLNLEYRGLTITKESFPTITIPQAEKNIQLKFYEKPMEVKAGNLLVRISSKDKKTISVEIKQASWVICPHISYTIPIHLSIYQTA